VLVIDKTHDPSNSLFLFSIDFSRRSMAAFLDVFDYDYEHEEGGYPLMPVRTMPFTKYCWAEKKMMRTGTTEMRLAAMT